MNLFQWKKELEIGIDQIDQQHKKLIEIANTLILRTRLGKGALTVSELLGQLEQYTKYHFQSEEAFQFTCNYPKYKNHMALHQSVSTTLKFSMVKLEASNYDENELNQFYTFFYDWITNHILIEDTKFASYYKQYVAVTE